MPQASRTKREGADGVDWNEVARAPKLDGVCGGGGGAPGGGEWWGAGATTGGSRALMSSSSARTGKLFSAGTRE